MVTVEGNNLYDVRTQLGVGEQHAWITIEPTPRNRLVGDLEADTKQPGVNEMCYRVRFNTYDNSFNKVMAPAELLVFIKNQLNERVRIERKARKLQKQQLRKEIKERLKSAGKCLANAKAALKEVEGR